MEDVERVVGLDVDAVVPSSGAEELLEVEVALRRTQAGHAVRGALKDGWMDGSTCSLLVSAQITVGKSFLLLLLTALPGTA